MAEKGKKQPTADELMNMGDLQRFGTMVKQGFGIAKDKIMGKKDKPFRMPVKTDQSKTLKRSLSNGGKKKRNSKTY
jgi:hypothetical protein